MQDGKIGIFQRMTIFSGALIPKAIGVTHPLHLNRALHGVDMMLVILMR